MAQNNVAMRKRTQIAKANRVMFLWIAAVSVVVGFAIVGSIFLAQKLLFNEKVLAEKEKTVSTLKHNNETVEELKSQVRILDNSQALIDSRTNSDEQAIQVVLDALPSDANPLALGASLQTKLLADIPNLTINSLQVDSLSDDTNSGSDETTGATSGASAISFRFSVSGSEESLKQVLKNLERSIRAINITSLSIEGQGNTTTLTVQAEAYYETQRVVELKDKTVKP